MQADALTASGYRVLMQSVEGTVDSFVKMKKRSLFVHFQGHPEYKAERLLKEYRRDIKRFLRKEQETYPSMPKGYFDVAATKMLIQFQDFVLADRREVMMECFPEAPVVGGLQHSWYTSASSIYQSWLEYLIAQKTAVKTFPPIAVVGQHISRKHSALL